MIRRLKEDNLNPCYIDVKADEAILCFSHDQGEEFLHLINPSVVELKKVEKFVGAKKLRFAGNEYLLRQIKKSVAGFECFEKEILFQDSFKAAYFPHTKKLRIERHQHQKENNEAVSSKKGRVLVIDDSRTIQKILSSIISDSEKLELIACADGPSEATKIIESERPDLITLDIHMPEMNGVEYLKTHLKNLGIPVVMISSVSMNEGPLVMEALTSGAMTYIEKPSLDQLKLEGPKIQEKLELVFEKGGGLTEFVERKTRFQFKDHDGLIAIGSSTGGTQALQKILTSLPDKIPATLIVQHIPAVFSKALADRLNDLCPFQVVEAENMMKVEKNKVVIAPGGKQLKLIKSGDSYLVKLTDDPPLNRFRPSVDYLFNSINKVYRGNLVGVILTGMGRDGAAGMKKLFDAGCQTLAQNEESCVVYGMPKAAVELGAVKKLIHLTDMADGIVLGYNQQGKQSKAS